MIYHVVFSRQASLELDAAADWWADHRDRNQAGQWYAGFSEKIWSLDKHPERLSIAAESDEFPFTIRELHYGLSSRPTHRAIYTVVGDKVLVLTIRHASQDRITPDDISDPISDE